MEPIFKESLELTEMRAEVSGWDRTGGYFVERVAVSTERRSIIVEVPRPMAPRSVLFVRRLLEDGSVKSKSEVLQVVRCQKHKLGGYRVRCRPANPRRETRRTTLGRLRFSNHFSNRRSDGIREGCEPDLCHSSHGAKPPII